MCVGGAEGGHKDKGVENRAGEESVLPGGEANLCPGAIFPREWGSVRGADFDAGDEAALANFVNAGVRS